MTDLPHNMLGVALPAQLPDRAYFIAIAGTGMGSLAAVLQSHGVQVTGSDKSAWPPIGPMLERMGVQLRMPYAAGNVPADAPLVVIGNAVGREHPEVKRVLELGLPYASMSEVLAAYVLPERPVYVAAGTHGKTTSSAALAYLLHALGADPGYLIGGQPVNFATSGHWGGARAPFAIEGDEYSSVYYDNGPKFAKYKPSGVVLPSLEFDHADVYGSEADYQNAFASWFERNGEALVCLDTSWPMARALAPGIRRKLQLGRRKSDEIHLKVHALAPHPRFSVTVRGQNLGTFETQLPGEHNCKNLALVIALLAEHGYSAARMAEVLPHFASVEKRQSVLYDGMAQGRGAVIWDFGHHPSEIRATLAALRGRWPEARICAAFEPRSYSSRRKVHEAGFKTAFGEAQQLLLAPVFNGEAIAESERLDTAAVASAHGYGLACTSQAELEQRVRACPADSLLVFFSNGDFDALPTRLAAERARG